MRSGGKEGASTTGMSGREEVEEKRGGKERKGRVKKERISCVNRRRSGIEEAEDEEKERRGSGSRWKRGE